MRSDDYLCVSAGSTRVRQATAEGSGTSNARFASRPLQIFHPLSSIIQHVFVVAWCVVDSLFGTFVETVARRSRRSPDSVGLHSRSGHPTHCGECCHELFEMVLPFPPVSLSLPIGAECYVPLFVAGAAGLSSPDRWRSDFWLERLLFEVYPGSGEHVRIGAHLPPVTRFLAALASHSLPPVSVVLVNSAGFNPYPYLKRAVYLDRRPIRRNLRLLRVGRLKGE
jgi:hypothetical protein